MPFESRAPQRSEMPHERQEVETRHPKFFTGPHRERAMAPLLYDLQAYRVSPSRRLATSPLFSKTFNNIILKLMTWLL